VFLGSVRRRAGRGAGVRENSSPIFVALSLSV